MSQKIVKSDIQRSINEIAEQLAILDAYTDEYLINPKEKKTHEQKVEFWKKWLTDRRLKW